jgi:hypothetical protein
VFETISYTACPGSQRKKSKFATTHIAKVDTMLSPKPGITPEGHCQPGTDPIPRTSQTEPKLAMQGHPWGSRRSYLKDGLARLSILILSKTYPLRGILSQIARIMKVGKWFWFYFQLKSKKKSMIYFQILAFKFYLISHSR